MPPWTISGPSYFRKSVKETAKRLGMSVGAYLRMAHQNQLKALTSHDFDRARRLMELTKSKEKLDSLRERETVLLREKGYKDKNVERILRDVDDPEIKEEIKRLAGLREEEAEKQLKLHEELNPTKRPLGHPPKSKETLFNFADSFRRCPYCGSTNLRKKDLAQEYLCVDCHEIISKW